MLDDDFFVSEPLEFENKRGKLLLIWVNGGTAQFGFSHQDL